MTEADPTKHPEFPRAVEVMLDAMQLLVHGKDDEELVFLDGFMRELGAAMGVDTSFPEIEPRTAGELREQWRRQREMLARGEMW